MTADRSPLTAPFTPFVDDTGMEFGRYVVKSLVGEGSMAQVYRAYDPLAERDVALKVLRADTGWRQGRGGRVRFFREAEAAGRLSHPYIVTIYDVTEDYIVMEYLDGVTLEYMLTWRAPMAFPDALAILHPIAAALDFAHEHGIVHRDVKPGNILILTDGRPKLTDFGVAHLDAATITAPGEFLGSPSYMSPEQVDGEAVSARSDVFSLAAVAYEMLTGARAFAGPSVPAALNAVLNVMPPGPTERHPALPAHIDAVFRRALAKRSEDRYASAGAFAAALDAEGFERTRSRITRGESMPVVRPMEREEAPGGAPPVIEPSVISARSVAAAETRDLGLLARPRPRAEAPGASDWRARLTHWAAVLATGTAIAALVSLALDPLGVFGQPKPDPGPALNVETQPPGASVWLDGRPLGSSPVSGVPIVPGRHDLSIEHPGYAAVRFAFEPNPSAAFRVALEPASTTGAARPSGTTVAFARPGEAIEASGAAAQAQPREDDATAAPFTAPRRVTGSAVGYPSEAVQQRLQGSVVVEFVVSPQGTVVDTVVVESAGPVLDGAVLDAVRTWRFWPATRGGRTVPARWQVRQRFDLPR